MYDYIIVGGGLAGTMLGYLMQRNGYNVIILEKQTILEKNKLCGGIITSKTYSFLCNYFSQTDIDNLIKNYTNKLQVHFENSNVCVDNVNLRFVKRQDLDNYVLRKYLEHGGIIVDNCHISHIDFQTNQIFTNKGIYEYKFLIGADGVLSQVRKLLFSKSQNKIFVLESFAEYQKNIENLIIELQINHYGYSYLIPLQDMIVCGSGNMIDNKKESMSVLEAIENLITNYDLNLQYPIKGAFIPSGDDIVLKQNNVYFIGDAAGLINPISGEGIYYALKSAERLFYSFDSNIDYSILMERICQEVSSGVHYAKNAAQLMQKLNFSFDKNIECYKEQITETFHKIIY